MSNGSEPREDISDRIRMLMEATPFRPFTVRTSDGEDYLVDQTWKAMLTSLTLHYVDSAVDKAYYIALTEIVNVSCDEAASVD